MRLLPVTAGNSHYSLPEWECPVKLKNLAGQKELLFCPLEGAKVPFRKEDGPGVRIPKPVCWKCFVIEFHKKIKSITGSNKALKALIKLSFN